MSDPLPAARSPRALLQLFHRAMVARSADALAELYAEDGVHEFSFFVASRPPRLIGREAVRASYRESWRDHPLEIDALDDVFVYDATDPEVVIGQWEIAARLRASDQRVRITGLLVLQARAGYIVHLRDFMDGLGVAHALGRLPFSPRAG